MKLPDLESELAYKIFRARGSFTLSEQEKAIYEWLGALPRSMVASFWDERSACQVDPAIANFLLMSCKDAGQQRWFVSKKLGEAFTLMPRIQKIQTRTGESMGKIHCRPALEKSIQGNFNTMAKKLASNKQIALPSHVLAIASSYRDCTVTIHSDKRENGYQYELILPYHGIEERLNRPIAELLHKPVDLVDPRLAQPAITGIERAISLGSYESSYSYEWDQTPGEIWKFVQTFVHLKNDGYVIKATWDNDEEDEGDFWQRRYWRRFLRKKQAVSVA